MQKINPPTIAPPAGQYSQCCITPAGVSLLHIAGQAGIASDGTLQDGFEAQMRQTWDNVLAILESQGLTAEALAHINYYLVDPEDVSSLRAIRKDYLPDPPPSSTTLIVSALVVPEWRFEMDAVAVIA